MTNAPLDQVTVQERSAQTASPEKAPRPRSRVGVLAIAAASSVLLAVSYLLTTISPSSEPASAATETSATAMTSASSLQSSSVVDISLDGSSVTSDGVSVLVDGATATITSPGTYVVSGILVGGRLIVDAGDDAEVRLVLHGATIIGQSDPAILVESAGKVTMDLASDSANLLADGGMDSNPSGRGVLFSASDLKVVGQGSLTVETNRGDGIVGEAGVTLATGTIRIAAAGDGLRAAGYVVLGAPDLGIVAGGDGIHSGPGELRQPPAETSVLGYVSIAGGTYVIDAGGDAIHAETDVVIYAGHFRTTSNTESTQFEETRGANAISGQGEVVINGGSFATDTDGR